MAALTIWTMRISFSNCVLRILVPRAEASIAYDLMLDPAKTGNWPHLVDMFKGRFRMGPQLETMERAIRTLFALKQQPILHDYCLFRLGDYLSR